MARCGGSTASRGPGAAREERGHKGGERGASERKKVKEMVAEQLRRDMKRLLKEEIQTDTTFCVGGTFLRAHQAVLLARVPEFFYHVIGRKLNTPTDGKCINLDNLDPSEFKIFLQIVYFSDGNIKEAEQEILEKGVSKLKFTKEDERLQVSHLQNSQISAEPCLETHEMTLDHQYALNRAVEMESAAFPFTANEIPEEVVDVESNITMSDDSASDLGKDLLMLYKKSWFSDTVLVFG